VDEVVFQKDCLFCGTNGGKKRLKKLSPAVEELNTVMAVGNRQLQGAQAAHQSDKPGKPLLMHECISPHADHVTLRNRYR
jgi:hypothetical protein